MSISRDDAQTPHRTDGDERYLTQQNKYYVLAELGRGGTAVVNLAVARGIGGFSKLVVLKTIKEDFRGQADFVRMFLNEARLSARMNHPNIVQTYEVYRDQGLPVIVMEYIEGQSMAKLNVRAFNDPAYTPNLLITILCRVLSGLHYAHSLTDFRGNPLNIVHRDVTPHNIMLTYQGQVKLLDFGIAKLNLSSDQTGTGIIKGKIGYMPPEQLEAGTLDARADVFAVGVILWEGLARRRFWGDIGEANIMRNLLSHEIPSLRLAKPDVDPELERICMKALAPATRDRYATAAEFQADLERYLQSHGGPVPDTQIADLVNSACADLRREAQRVLDAALQAFAAESPEGWEDAMRALEGFRSNPPEGYNAQSTKTNAADKGRSRLTVLSGVLFAAAGALGIYAWMQARAPADVQREGPVVSAPPAPPPPAATTTPPPPAEPAMARVRFVVRPLSAKLFWDGEPLTSNPYEGDLPLDKARHELRAEAEGYKPLVRNILLESDMRLELAMEAEPKPTPVVRPRPAPARPRSGTTPAESAAAPPPPAPTATADCNPPYVIDASGIKRYRLECLQR
ncbi:MAG: serine/threonine-protein kinase [Pseudomonadota bacterium]